VRAHGQKRHARARARARVGFRLGATEGGPHLSATAGEGRGPQLRWATTGPALGSLGRAGLTDRNASEPGGGKGGAAADFP
jgi:hypothetical protein